MNSRKKKYLLIGDGESVHLAKWTKELVHYFDLYFISLRKLHPDIEAIIPNDHCELFRLNLNSNGGNAQIIQKIKPILQLIKKWEPEIINCHYVTSAGFLGALAKLLSSKKFFLIQSTWGSDILVTPKRNLIYKIITKFSLNSADLISSDSEFMSDEIKKLSKTTICNFTFGIDKMPDCQLADKDPNLWFSNRGLTDIYRIDKIIDFFADYKSYNTEAKLIISNDGHLREILEKKVKDKKLEDSISFLGFLNPDSQNKIYQKTQFFISLPDSDSTSVSLIEAMSYGCIPILSNLPANREWVDSSINGLIEPINQNDIELLLKNRQEIFNFNRNLIHKKAIFPELIRDFLEKNHLV